MTDLKPCPFCGSPAELERHSDHHGGWFNLGCSRHWGNVDPKNVDPDAACIAGRMFYTEDPDNEAKAIAAWNTRASCVRDEHTSCEDPKGLRGDSPAGPSDAPTQSPQS